MGYYTENFEVLKVGSQGPELLRDRYALVRKPYHPEKTDKAEAFVLFWGETRSFSLPRETLEPASADQAARVLYLVDADRVATEDHEELFVTGTQFHAEVEQINGWVDAILGHEFTSPFLWDDLVSYQAHIQADADPRVYGELNQDALVRRWREALAKKAELDELEARVLT